MFKILLFCRMNNCLCNTVRKIVIGAVRNDGIKKFISALFTRIFTKSRLNSSSVCLIGVSGISFRSHTLIERTFSIKVSQISPRYISQMPPFACAAFAETTPRILRISVSILSSWNFENTPPPYCPHIHGNFHTFPQSIAHPAERRIKPSLEPSFLRSIAKTLLKIIF